MAKGKTGVTLNWGGLDRVVGGAARSLADRRGLLRSVGETLVSSTVKRFRDGESPEGDPWDPSARTQQEGGVTLVDTARLRNSIGYATTTDAVLVGTSVEYAAIHQKGGQTGRNHAVTMPARPFIGISAEDKAEVGDLLANHIAAAFGGKR